MDSGRLLLEALNQQNLQGRPPVWFMRQAGRYMPSYQKLRERYSLIELFTHPELITQVTLLPVEELQLDAAIVFSDILLVLKALGLEVGYSSSGVQVETLSGLDDSRLSISTERMLDQLPYLSKAISQLRNVLRVPLIGFTAAPFTLACYALDGSRAALAQKTKKLMWSENLPFSQLLSRLGDHLYALAEFQVKAGAQVIHLFDSHTNVLSPEEFSKWVLPSLVTLIQKLHELGVPVIYFSRCTGLFMPFLEQLPPCAIGVDWQSSLLQIRSHTKRTLQGNFNPWALLSSPSHCRSILQEMLKHHGLDPAYICGLGHGILPETPWENIRMWVDIARNFHG